MTYNEAIEWLSGKRSMCNLIPQDPFETWQVRIAQADAAQTEQAYWIVKASAEKLLPPDKPAQFPPVESLDPWDDGLIKVRNALTDASNELHDLEWEASYCAMYKRLDQLIDASAGTLTELIDARHGDPSGDYDAS